jgi:hypothetical protein
VALKEISANFGLGYLYIYVGMSHFALGRLHLAQLSYRKALDLAATRFPHESQRVEALACIAEAQYYENDLQGARRNIDAARFSRLVSSPRAIMPQACKAHGPSAHASSL